MTDQRVRAWPGSDSTFVQMAKDPEQRLELVKRHFLPADSWVSCWGTVSDALSALTLYGPQGSTEQLRNLLALEDMGELDGPGINLDSMKYSTALLIHPSSHLGEANIVVDRDGMIGFYFEEEDERGGRDGAIVVKENGDAVLALKADKPDGEGEYRLQALVSIDSAAGKIGEFVTGELQ